MGEKGIELKQNLRKVIRKALKATIKGTIIYSIYLLISLLLTPLSQLIPGIQEMLGAFVIVYVVLTILGDITAGTLYHHILGAAREVFAIGYLIVALNGGLFGMTLEDMTFQIDLRLFLTVALALSLIGIAKTVLQTIDYMNTKAEVSYF